MKLKPSFEIFLSAYHWLVKGRAFVHFCVGSFVWGDGEVARRKSRAKAATQEDGGVLLVLNEEQVR